MCERERLRREARKRVALQKIFQLWSQLGCITVEKGLYSKRRRLESCYFIIATVRNVKDLWRTDLSQENLWLSSLVLLVLYLF